MLPKYTLIALTACLTLFTTFVYSQDMTQNQADLKIYEKNSVDDKGYKTVWHEYYDEFGAPVKHGTLEKFYPGGRKFNAMTYAYGQLEGETSTWYESGQVKTIGQFKSNDKTGRWIHYNEDGSVYRELEYINDRPEGPYFKNHENGKLHEKGFYKNGLRDGFWTTWYPNGQKRSEGNFIEGKRDSSWIWWHENGQVSSKGFMKEGKRVSDWQDWYDNGQVEKAYSFDSLGTMVGDYREFYPDGSRKVEGVSVNGKKDGPWREWDEKGNLVANRTFIEGVVQTDSTSSKK